MKQTMTLILLTFAFVFVLMGCSASRGIPDGTYTMNSIVNGVGIGNTFTVKDNTMTIPVYGIAGADYSYKIDGKQIKLTAQGATVSYPYEKKGDTYIIGGVEYVQGNGFANSNEEATYDSSKDLKNLTATTRADVTELIEDSAEEPEPHYEPLNLFVTMREDTILLSDTWAEVELMITLDGDLVDERVSSMEKDIVDKDVRTLYAHNGLYVPFFYIKNDNSLWGWGSNRDGILGDGTGVDRNEIVNILDNVAWITSFPFEFNSIYALKTDKTLWKWGDGIYEPVLVAENAIKPLTKEWYLNNEGFIINFETDEKYMPEPVYDFQFLENNDSALYINSERNLMIRKSIGGSKEYDVSLIAEDVTRFRVIQSSRQLSIHFIKSDGSLWGYGINDTGQLGDGTKIPERNEPVKIADDVVEVLDRVFLKTNGELWVWDINEPTPQKVINDVAQIRDANRNYIISSNGKFHVLNRNSYTWWTYLAIEGCTVELDGIKVPQMVTFP